MLYRVVWTGKNGLTYADAPVKRADTALNHLHGRRAYGTPARLESARLDWTPIPEPDASNEPSE